ncbi:MAG: hypothetical protein V1897_09795, partial [Pseudomonadota bacterium]
KERPWLGIGLRAPREYFVDSYKIGHPQYSKEQFTQDIQVLETQENMFLTTLVGLGIPFFVLYMFFLIVFGFRLLANCIRGPSGESTISPVSLLIPLAAGIVYCTMTDILMLPSSAWFFHVLLGMAPTSASMFFKSSVEKNHVTKRLAMATATIAIGVVIGTHPFLAPYKLSINSILDWVKSLPVITGFVMEESGSQTTSSSSKTGDENRNDPQLPGSYSPHETSQIGTLIVKIPDYRGIEVGWGICAIIDNSKSMSADGSPWEPNKLAAAIKVAGEIGESMPKDSRLMIRSFYDEGPLYRKGKDLYLRVTKVISGWAAGPLLLSGIDLKHLISDSENNLCMAAASSLETDFRKNDSQFPRVLLLTDGTRQCQLTDFMNKLRVKKFGWDAARLDLIVFGNKAMVGGNIQSVISKTGGVFLEVIDPNAIHGMVELYLRFLKKPLEQLITVTRTDGLSKPTDAKPSEQLILQSGIYNIAIPAIGGSSGEKRIIERVKVVGHKTTIVEIPADEKEKPYIRYLGEN